MLSNNNQNKRKYKEEKIRIAESKQKRNEAIFFFFEDENQTVFFRTEQFPPKTLLHLPLSSLPFPRTLPLHTHFNTHRHSFPPHSHQMSSPSPSSPPPHGETSSLREEIRAGLESGTYECLVCVDRIGSRAPVWTCSTCHCVFHLDCAKDWVRQSTTSTGEWRCPQCQAAQRTDVALEYRCFCGAQAAPDTPAYATPHTCGATCKKLRKSTPCPHPCTEPCHPGPCPPCTLPSDEKACHCGKTSFVTGCSDTVMEKSCGEVCGKGLPCGKHVCERECHAGKCAPCGGRYPQGCFCGKIKSEVRDCKQAPDDTEQTEGTEPAIPLTFSCMESCPKKLLCGAHPCPLPCHYGECPECHLLPDAVSTCACGKVSLTELAKKPAYTPRTSCTDPLQTCGSICGKALACNQRSHRCTLPCHDGPCPPCAQPVIVKCRCGGKSANLTCADSLKPEGTSVPTVVFKAAKEDFDIFSGKKGKKKKTEAPANVTLPFRCAVRCSAQKSCKKHVCQTVCCAEKGGIHICEAPCNKPLACGGHRCPRSCHAGRCPDCLQGIFDELSCRCGGTVILPPIPCGTEPPACPLPCSIPRPCRHPPLHGCHYDLNCPPCTEMVTKRCASHNKPCAWMSPCYLTDVVCKEPCYKKSCRQNASHFCERQCHTKGCGPCEQPCGKRLACNHSCTQRCHTGSCPPCGPCAAKVLVFCKCGIASERVLKAVAHTGYTARCGAECAAMRERLRVADAPPEGGEEGGE